MKFKVVLFVVLLSAFNISAQFGQNKVQFNEYDWYFIQTKHFDIYFSLDGSEIAEFTAKVAEESLADLESDLDYEINSRISLIVYNSHNDFAETNTSDSYISQGIGGFTEPFKNRVVFPFEGSYQKFEHVIHHELVHAVMRDMLYGGTVQNIIAKGISLQLPLWYHEGMAEYLASEWETNSDMFIRDAIINEYLPDIERLDGYFAYRGGQSLFYYIASQYGPKKVGEMLSKIRGAGDLESGLKASIGLTLEELNTRWKKDLKRTYWPEIAYRKDPSEMAKQLTENKKTGGFYNTSPAISPQGDKIAFISDRDIFLNVYIMNSFDGKVIKQVVESGLTNDFEELNLLYPSLTWAPDNKRIALSVKRKGFDRIYVIDTDTEEETLLDFELPGIESVSWSPDGEKIVFNGSNSSQSDLYVFEFTTKTLRNITNDMFSEDSPVWGPDSKNLYFSSDRGDFVNPYMIPEDFEMSLHNYNQTDLYKFSFQDEKVYRLTDWALSSEKSPVINPEGTEMLFVSDYNGIDNIFKLKLMYDSTAADPYLSEKPAPITNSLNGLNQLSLSKDGKKLVFGALYNSGYNIFLLNNPFELKTIDGGIKMTAYMEELVSGKKGNIFSDSVLTNDEIVYKDSSSQTTEGENFIFTGQYENVEDSTNRAETSKYRNFVFGEDIASDSSNGELSGADLFVENLDSNGNYLLNKYKVSFSPDLIYANAGYSTFYGLLGTTVLSFSDVLGNHRLIGVTSLQVDLKNSDYGLAYYYLAKKIDYGVEAFHTARFVYLSNMGKAYLHRFRNYGLILSASLPLSRFYRFESALSYLNVSAENLDDITQKNETVTYLIPSLSFAHDNTLFGYYSPIQGSRYNIGILGNPGFGESKRSFYSITFDYRKYMRFWYDNSFVIRFSGGYSGGANPQNFFLGGVDSWSNRSFSSGEIPIRSASDFAFLSPALPMRGYDYAAQVGTKYSLLNLELRMPIIRALLTGPLPILFQNILGNMFIDAGSAWSNNKQLQLFAKDEYGNLITKDLLLGMGYGFRWYLIFLWKLDIAWSFDMQHFSLPKYYLSIGLDF